MSTIAIADYRGQRTKLISALKKTIRPYLRESGYRRGSIGNSRPLKLWVPRDAQGKLTNKSFALRGGFVVGDFEGFTEDGVITDSEGHGLASRDWQELPIEDLFRLKAWVDKNLFRLTEYERTKQGRSPVASKETTTP